MPEYECYCSIELLANHDPIFGSIIAGFLSHRFGMVDLDAAVPGARTH